jgi:DNA-binding IclR family transcriptional regulator
MEHLNDAQVRALRRGLLALLKSTNATPGDMKLMLEAMLITDEDHPISVTSLADITGLPRQSVKNRTDVLIDQGFLARHKSGLISPSANRSGQIMRSNIFTSTADEIRAASSTDQSTYSLPLSA